ncbi:predicted protein [Chaetoceros tenuissimus]|uniref:Uncharacterized protein n=1 Tax=Chaetoceros tenuissimus TaxID=426638 RepID=A0AAD3CGG3_9STRA|nr:predicted protein [Chaetoceros tenuissimus]
MDILVATSAAWLAGIVEGRTVLRHELPNEDEVKLIVPSLFYGTVSLPLTVIGSSPSMHLVASNTSIALKTIEAPKEIKSKSVNEKETNVDANARKMKVDFERKDKVSDWKSTFRRREDNKRTLKDLDSAVSARSKAEGVSSKALSTSMLSRSLPNAMAENLRRSRILLLGYSAVSCALLYQKIKDGREEGTKAESRTEKSIPFQSQECKQGISFRLIKDDEFIDNIERSISMKQRDDIPCSVPLTISKRQQITMEQRNIPCLLLEGRKDESIIDRNTLEKAIHKTNVDGKKERYIVLESIGSTHILDGIGNISRKSKADIKSSMEAELMSRSIQNILPDKEENDLKIKYIEVGTNIDPKQTNKTSFDIIPSDRIAINSMEEVGSRLKLVVHGILLNDKHSQPIEKKSPVVPQRKQTDKATKEFKEKVSKSVKEYTRSELQKESNLFLRVVDLVGMQIRNVGEAAISASTTVLLKTVDTIGKGVAKGAGVVLESAKDASTSAIKNITGKKDYKATIHIFADEKSIFNWTKHNVFPNDYKLVWHDIRQSKYPRSKYFEKRDKDIFMVLASDDVYTMHACAALGRVLPKKCLNRLISVVQKPSSKEFLLSIEGDTQSSILCMTEVHEELVANAKSSLLAPVSNE